MWKLSGILLLVLTLWALTACGPTGPDVAELTSEYQALTNAHDVEAVMQRFALDARFEMVGQGVLDNPQAIRSLHAYDSGIDTELQFSECEVDGLSISCKGREANAWLEAAGLEDIHYPEITIRYNQQGLIHEIRAALAQKDAEAIGAVLAEFVPWLFSQHPEAAALLFSPEGTFIYSESNGELVVEMLRTWRASPPPA